MKVNKKKKGISTKAAMNLVILTLGIITTGYLVALGVLMKKTQNKSASIDVLPQICFTDTCFNTELAVMPEERKQGLMYRQSMKENNGMLFFFDELGTHRFRMKNTLIPLDIIRFDEDRKILYIEKDVQPCPEKFSKIDACSSYGPYEPTKYVLEVNAGLTEKYGIKIGDEAHTVETVINTEFL